jgi:hypothetical protein
VTEDQRMQHAIAAHALRHKRCLACEATADPACSVCNGHGVLYQLDTAPCGQTDCRIGRGQA